MPNAFPASARVLKPGDFTRAMGKGRRRRDASMTVTACPNGLAGARLGLAVSRRVGNAVARNRVKRLLREAFRLNREAFAPGYDFVVTPQGGPRAWSLEGVTESLLKLSKEAAR